jgi:hypothetical protein
MPTPQPNPPIPVPEPDVIRPPTPQEEPQPDKGPELPQPGPDVVIPPGQVITPSQPQEIPPGVRVKISPTVARRASGRVAAAAQASAVGPALHAQAVRGCWDSGEPC